MNLMLMAMVLTITLATIAPAVFDHFEYRRVFRLGLHQQEPQNVPGQVAPVAQVALAAVLVRNAPVVPPRARVREPERQPERTQVAVVPPRARTRDARQVLKEPETPEDMYVEWCSTRIKEGDHQMEEAVRIATEKARSASVAVLSMARHERDFDALARALAKQESQNRAEADQAIKEMLAHPKIARVDLCDFGWRLVTLPISMEIRGQKYQLGKMEIIVGWSGEIRIFNQARRVSEAGRNYDHPRIVEGHPHLPIDHWTWLIACAVRKDFHQIIAIVLNFLEKVEDEPLVAAENWPKERPNVAILQAKI